MGWGDAIGQVVGSGINAISTGVQNKKNRRFAEKQAEISWGRTLDLREMDNQYNSPQAQMQRLRQAGISPLLPFLGKGSASGGTAATAQTAPKAEHKGIAPQLSNSMMNIVDLKMKKAGTDKIIEETDGLKTANERALITWLEDKGYIKETQAAAAAQKIAEAGLKDLELGVQTGKDSYWRTQTPGSRTESGRDITGGHARAEIEHSTIKKANNLIDANAQNVQAQNQAQKALKEWLNDPKGGWEALKATLLIILGRR